MDDLKGGQKTDYTDSPENWDESTAKNMFWVLRVAPPADEEGGS